LKINQTRASYPARVPALVAMAENGVVAEAPVRESPLGYA
jgi:hypothetical protein